MTAKERLHLRIEAFSEEEAGEALRLLDMRADPVVAAFRDAPPDDEPWTAENEAAAAQAALSVRAHMEGRLSRGSVGRPVMLA
jgi:hypothetical protein